MNKTNLLKLEQNSRLTLTELRRTQPALAKELETRLEQRVQRMAKAGARSKIAFLERMIETISNKLSLKIPYSL
ncbi:MAG: hypothetical protein JW841_01255, partial [Deltaproteobacteria bacterium]|nr:hypothetical protein [Deltaproteobacteria bacterium]